MSEKESKFTKCDLSEVKIYSIANRKSKIDETQLAKPYKAGGHFTDFLQKLPHILKAADFYELVDHILTARKKQKPVIVLMGAHVIKVGLSPIVIDLMEQGIITTIAMNGAGAIHDTELAYWGKTSEDVAQGLEDGSFGMARETGDVLNNTVSAAQSTEMGFGEALGKRIEEDKPPHKSLSIFAAGYRLALPVTVHVAIGTDIVHQQPSVDGAAIGELTMRDFQVFTEQVKMLKNGGVVLHIGSNVILPEVFLKALTVARNVAPPVNNFFTANFDMYTHYRPRMNVVERPTQTGGKGYNFIGHHEIMIPLLAAAVKERISE